MLNFCEFGDCRETMRRWIAEGVKVQMCVTSPPYWGLRDYGTAKWEGGDVDCDHIDDPGLVTLNTSSTLGYSPGGKERGEQRRIGENNTTAERTKRQFLSVCGKCGARRVDFQLGLEPTPQEYVANMVEVFRLVRDLLADDGVLFLNLGDSYWGGGRGGNPEESPYRKQATNRGSLIDAPNWAHLDCGLKPKDLVGIPWRVAFALQQPYYNWQIKTEAMRAWVGGIVDGEGCITILETKSSHSESLSYPPIIQVRMCDIEPLDRLVQVVGSSYGKPQHPPSQVAANQRPSWQWKIVSEQAANIIAEIYPFLTCKRKQAIVAWNHQAFRSARGNQKRERGDIEKEQFCKTLINALNQREAVDIPSWMKEPAVIYEPGWYLRQDLIWAKPNPMPESVRDRCTKSHEYIFLLSKSPRYYYDADAIAEPISESYANDNRPDGVLRQRLYDNSKYIKSGMMEKLEGVPDDHENRATTRNKRSVWAVPTVSYAGAHFATFPPALIEPCILAGSRPGDAVLDPFMGSGTTGQVAQDLGRQWLGCELNPDYEPLQKRRTEQLGMVLA